MKYWHKLWAIYHFKSLGFAFRAGNYHGAQLHSEKFIEHGELYVNKHGGKAEDVFG